MPKQGLNRLERVCYVLGHLIFGLDGVPVDHRLRSHVAQSSSSVNTQEARDTTQKHHLRHRSHRGTAR